MRGDYPTDIHTKENLTAYELEDITVTENLFLAACQVVCFSNSNITIQN